MTIKENGGKTTDCFRKKNPYGKLLYQQNIRKLVNVKEEKIMG